MDTALKPRAGRFALLLMAVAPVIPQLFGSAFNIWYNKAVVLPLLGSQQLQDRFFETVIAYNAIAYPLAVTAWLRGVYSLRNALRAITAGESIDTALLNRMRRRVIHLPFRGAVVSGAGWLLCIPVFLLSLWQAGSDLNPLLFWHLPISFLVSAFIAITHSFFLIELASHRTLFPIFFHNTRADLTPDAFAISLRGRGLLWAISAGICPIGSLLLLSFAPPAPGSDPQWFAVFVGTVGITFGLCTAILLLRLVVEPIDYLRAAAQSIARGDLEVRVPLLRADEFGLLIAEFNHMIGELQEKERLRQTFGLHVGKQAAEEILARDPGLGGIEETITVMFVDIRSFTERAERTAPRDVLQVLNAFLRAMVQVVEESHGGLINKFLGDGFMALFGIGGGQLHADAAVKAGCEMLGVLANLNQQLIGSGLEPLAIGIGVHTGQAIVGSIGSPQRLEFTAIGGTVNLTSRIESLTKVLGVPLLISEATRSALQQSIALQEYPPQKVKGIAEPIRVFSLRC
ncbi:MAG: adenylate/guanylate cyclase with integral rane sensor [Chthoniobacteraceae bacterium]|nr:adenylate/guanylate cyclase with integral rane sensor [Chthoniobacteraceae bacterium]